MPEWILDAVIWLAYQLVCKPRGHKPGRWFSAHGPVGTQARLCDRCLRGQHLIHGEATSWTR